ncbi:putative protein OS=Tsukamurella paurometabola (strain ATCC 8368 / DSM / CCUG 35730 /CIP 100753 / JCM 10117 / KCTC 9821 / NBRC 16120 / NCIMB 702349/ NCTC 13040) OX=521096 GN=Tpau_0425 PE=4 SV=1 [Tsukamurella paurometabola]|uniref:Uncharacterized protein n=1 Tax=Tsukamurella paurometabola (strain ATCC 8368 / DSM 20162 / CCUG 35730 / CIP 100753 / JCM 10117 / KCTC 9821 / NBRC 16120 / NCIMB 702349 / NCTC 13040) TaxID=521096 RepID=D5URL3_TSUPD|nr:hypothetical protein Tpau_0425 [Tsukamurella paurometabola DSM 20162]SUP42655.1 Uncharacterised protein [Tsukamurella paurometabola]
MRGTFMFIVKLFGHYLHTSSLSDSLAKESGHVARA